MMSMAGLFIPGARETVEMMYEFEKPFVVDSSKFERAFGVVATPIAGRDQGHGRVVPCTSQRLIDPLVNPRSPSARLCATNIKTQHRWNVT